MADWQFKLEFKEFWQDDEIALFDKSQKVVDGIKALLSDIRKQADSISDHFKAFKQLKESYMDMADELENDILPMFEALVETESEDVEDFDYALEALYEWADTSLDNKWGGKKMCWVNTF